MKRLTLTAGLVYLGIIILGLSAELLLRAPLLGTTAEETARAVSAAPSLLRGAILADAAMIALDVTLAVLLWTLLRPMGPILSGVAAALRLIQAAVLSANLLLLQAATFGPADEMHRALVIHAAGYDLGLLFFAGSTLAVAVLLARWSATPRFLPPLLGVAALTYAIGSVIRIVAPSLSETFAPAYLIPVIAEISFAFFLLREGMRQVGKEEMVGDDRFELPTSSM